MSFHSVHYPVCQYCGDIFPDGDSDPKFAKDYAIRGGWQVVPVQWTFGGVEVWWDFYCPTHRRDEYEDD